MQDFRPPDNVENSGTAPSGHTPQEMGDLLRTVDFALSHGMTALVAFGDRRYLETVARDHQRMGEARKQIAEALKRLPAAVPLTDEQMEKVGRVVGAVLDKRFGDGSQGAVDSAMSDWFGGEEVSP